jgi:cellulose synthase/poly-beta-1,6-N-acetylglucosamine synthase-like glycosyltransferase
MNWPPVALLILAVSSFGLSLTIWGIIGVVRWLGELIELRRGGKVAPVAHRVTLDDVAVLIPAHNEEPVIEDTLAAITRLAPAHNVHVVSDGSSDRTAELARAAGVNVLEIPVAGGKARGLKTGIEHFALRERYKAVLLLDADTRLDERYFDLALPLFDDPEVSSVAGCAATAWNPRRLGWRGAVGRVLNAHRDRTYWLFQRLVKYGQCWRYANVAAIVPGFASLYRTTILHQIDIDAPGMVIEDFNMTFEVHHRRLGRVAFNPDAVAYTQDPHRLRDYNKQVRRWALGFWQTLRQHGLWVGKFWLSMVITVFELITSSLSLLLAAFAVLVLGVGDLFESTLGGFGPFAALDRFIGANFSYWVLFLGIVLPDFALTIIVAVLRRRPLYLLAGLFFVPLRLLDGVAILVSLPKAWFVKSTGRWVSPQRQATSNVTQLRPAERASSLAGAALADVREA